MSKHAPAASLEVRAIPVSRVRPEEGLGRKRGRAGHAELAESIAKFGVLTPITVRPAPDGSGDFLLVKGQGRTLACAQLGLETVPAIVVGSDFSERDKVGQFLVENVARLKMRPVDRALLISHARQQGEETISVARRFGVAAATVRRLEAQLDGASSAELAGLREGKFSLALHAVVARHALPDERADLLNVLSAHAVSARDAEALLAGVGWRGLRGLAKVRRSDRLLLLDWFCRQIVAVPGGTSKQRIAEVAAWLPASIADCAWADPVRRPS